MILHLNKFSFFSFLMLNVKLKAHLHQILLQTKEHKIIIQNCNTRTNIHSHRLALWKQWSSTPTFNKQCQEINLLQYSYWYMQYIWFSVIFQPYEIPNLRTDFTLPVKDISSFNFNMPKSVPQRPSTDSSSLQYTFSSPLQKMPVTPTDTPTGPPRMVGIYNDI